MTATQQVNADPNKVVVMNTNKMDWESTANKGVSRKTLERVNDARKGRETSLLRLDAGAELPAEELTERVDLFVLEGSCSDGAGTYGMHTFVRNQPGTRFALSSADGCTLYMKRRVAIRKSDTERMVVDGKNAQWTPFPARGARVLHLYRDVHGVETARIGDVYPERKIPSHDHAMGEETFIIDGCLKDEHDSYGPGVWFRFPIGVPHAPFTEQQNALMLIREGDLVW